MDIILPQILPEEIAPPAVQSCSSCDLSNQRTRVVWGEGNHNAPIFVILDNPGAREDKNGKPFLCGTRQTLQRAAYEVGLNSTALYVSYVLKCRPIRSYNKEMSRSVCIKYLWEQIRSVNPLMAVCLGNIACQSFFGDSEVEVKNLRGKVHNVRDYKTVVSYHPLAVRRKPFLYKYFREDWELVVCYLSTNPFNLLLGDVPTY